MAVLVDSSGWIEFFVGGPNCDRFATAIQSVEELIVPTISITEVYRWMVREASTAEALTVVAAMKQGRVRPLDATLAIMAAELSHKHQLPLADGIIYATARMTSAELLTQDSDLQGLPGVAYFAHPAKKA